jgi:hypothetical protein
MKLNGFLASALLALVVTFAPAIGSTHPTPTTIAASASIPMFDSEADAHGNGAQ